MAHASDGNGYGLDDLNDHHAKQYHSEYSGPSSHTRLLRKVQKKVDPSKDDNKDSWPTFRSTALAVSGFAVFGLVGCLAIGFPTEGARIALPIFALIVDLAILASIYTDITKKRKKFARRNVANTVLLCFLTIILMTFLYEFLWYDGRNSPTIKSSIERSTTQRYPGVLVLTQDNYPGQANLMFTPPRPPPICILGPVNSTYEPNCTDMTKEEVMELADPGKGNTCNCSSYWAPEIEPEFSAATHFRYLNFTPGPEMVTNKTLVFMNLIVPFSFNSSNLGNVHFGPSLWILIFDPTQPVDQAYRQAGSEFTLVDANSQIIVDLSPRSSKDESHSSKSPVNSTSGYNAVINTIHNFNQPCDVAGNYSNPCEAHISIRFATFDNQVTTIEDEKSFGDTIESVGAFFALAQLLSWILSGVAWVG